MNKIEVWKDIKGYEGLYQVSNKGAVKNIRKQKNLKPNNKEGYHRYHLSKFGKVRVYQGHRLVADAFIIKPEGKTQVNHINGIKNDNRTCNLEWLTGSENCRHSWDTGLQKPQYGDDRYCSKLKEVQVKEIKRELISGAGVTDLSRKYNVSPMTISDIKRNKTWVRVSV